MRSPPLSLAAAKSEVQMAALGSGLLPGLHRFFWPEGRLEADLSPWLSPFAQKVLWWTLVAFAVLDVVHPIPSLTGGWWCAFFVLWIVPWRRPVATAIPWVRIATWLSSLILFGWLIYRTQTAVHMSLRTWHVFSPMSSWNPLSFPMRATLSTLVTAAFVVAPLRRVVGERATTIVIIASLPCALMYRPIRFSYPLVWKTQTMQGGTINICDGALSLLVVAEVSCLLTRFPLNVDLIPGYRRLRIFAIGLLNGNLNAFVAVFVLYSGALAGCFLFARLWMVQYWTPHTFGTAAICSVVAPVPVLIVLLSALATWRSLARAGQRHVVIDNLATFGRLFVGTTAPLVALFGFFSLMPRAGDELSEALQILPGPDWSISPAGTPGVLRLSGIFQYGVSDALASALAHDPSIRRLELDSPGGDCGQGLALAALVEKRSLSTFVGHQCSSACTLVFVAGKERVLRAGAKLGFHRARSPVWDDALTDDDKYNSHLITYLESKGVAASFARKAFQVPNNDIWYPSVEELLAAGVINNTSQSQTIARSVSPSTSRQP